VYVMSQNETREYLESPDSLCFSVDGETWTSPLEDFDTVSTVLVSRSAIKKSGSMMYTLMIMKQKGRFESTMLSIHIGATIHNDTDLPLCVATPGHVSRLKCKGVAPLGAWYDKDDDKNENSDAMYVFRVALDKTLAASRRKRLWSSNIVLDTSNTIRHVRKRISIPTMMENQEIPLMLRYVAARSNIGVWHVMIHRDSQPPATFCNKTELCLELATLPRSESTESLIVPPRACFDFDLNMLNTSGEVGTEDEDEGSFQISMKDDERKRVSRGIRFQLRVWSQSSNLVWSQPVYVVFERGLLFHVSIVPLKLQEYHSFILQENHPKINARMRTRL